MKCDKCHKSIGSATAIQTAPDHMNTMNERLLCDDCHKEFSDIVEAWLKHPKQTDEEKKSPCRRG